MNIGMPQALPLLYDEQQATDADQVRKVYASTTIGVAVKTMAPLPPLSYEVLCDVWDFLKKLLPKHKRHMVEFDGAGTLTEAHQTLLTKCNYAIKVLSTSFHYKA